MHAWEAVQKSVDYIEDHIKEEVNTNVLAEIAGLSPFYFQRLFKRLVKKPVQEYIKLRRLARVIGELNTGDQRILDIALEYGFSNHANFTRAFKETYGLTPEEYKRTRPQLNTFLKPDISLQYVMLDEGVPLITGSIVLEINRKTMDQPETWIGFSGNVKMEDQIPAGEQTGVDVPGQLWDRFHKEKETLIELMNPDLEMGMAYQANAEAGSFSYFTGGLSWIDCPQLTGDWIAETLPAGEYVVCSLEAETFEELVTNALYQANGYLYETWLPGHGLASEPFAAEKYYRNTEEQNYMEIWVKPVKLKQK